MLEERPASPRPSTAALSAGADLLRRRFMDRTYRCPKGAYVAHCPFKGLAGLSHTSRETILAALSEERLVGLLELAQPCLCPEDPPADPRPVST